MSCAWITYRKANVVHLPEATRAVDRSCIHVTVRFLIVDVAEFNLSYVSTFLGDEVHRENLLWQSRHEFFHEGMLLWVSCESRSVYVSKLQVSVAVLTRIETFESQSQDAIRWEIRITTGYICHFYPHVRNDSIGNVDCVIYQTPRCAETKGV